MCGCVGANLQCKHCFKPFQGISLMHERGKALSLTIPQWADDCLEMTAQGLGNAPPVNPIKPTNGRFSPYHWNSSQYGAATEACKFCRVEARNMSRLGRALT
jgi:hypothetical protein